MVGQVIRIAVLVAHLLVLSLQLKAQNIIDNGSFENLNSCPNSAGDAFRAQPWRSGVGSPDLFNVCGEDPWRVPLNWGGFQPARTGDGYASIATYAQIIIDARETLWQPIRYALTEGEQYYFEMYVSLRDSAQFATHNIGIVFEDTMLNELPDLECLFDCNPVVENTSANPLDSRTDWQLVSGTFTAEGNEKFIHIGNLRDDASTELEFIPGGAGNEPVDWAYSVYYIDDVWLSHIDSMGYVSVNEELGVKNDELLLYPNPATDVLNVTLTDFSTRSSVEMTVVDFCGREVESLRGDCFGSSNLAMTGNCSIDVSGWPAGIYLLSVRDENGNMVSKRVVKE